MALIDKASLLMVPSTYEAGKLYNVLPSGNRAPDNKGGAGYDQTRADFDFDRGSNTAATRIGSDGLIKKYRENLLTESNNFSDSDWSPKAGTFAQGIEDPNGGNEAWSWTATNTDPYLYQAIGTSGVFTLSIYAKGVGSTIGKVLELRNGSTTQNFTLTSEWQRFELYAAAGGSNIGFEFGNPAVIGDVMYIYAAQWETGLVATDYLDSGATTAKAGVLVDLPRINYDANGENGALLLEPSRKNSIQFSEYFGASYWTKSGASVVSGFTSPEGLSNAYKLVEDTSSGTHSFVFPAINTSSNNTYSIYVKSNGRTKIGFREVQETGYYAAFNLSSNAVIEKSSQVTASIVPLNNGWKRCEINFPVTTSTVMGFYMLSDSYTTGDPLTTTYTGDGSSGVHIFGAQLELGSYATSYIPNHGESGGITRAADFGSDDNITESPIEFGANDDFTLFYEGSFNDLSSTSNMIMGGGRQQLGASYKSYWWVENATSMRITGDAEVRLATTSMSLSNNTNYKLLVKRSGSVVDFFVDGAKLTTTQNNPNTAFTFRSLGWSYTNSVYKVSGNIKKAMIFNEALTDAECITLTA